MSVRGLSTAVDRLLLPLLIFLLAWVPNYQSGELCYEENGSYLSVINSLFEGRAFYRDIYASYGPLMYTLPAAAMKVFGANVLTLKQFFLTTNILSLMALYVLCRQLIRSRGWAVAAALMIVVQTHHPYFAMHWGGPRYLFGYCFLIALVHARRERSRGWSVIAGLVGGLAALSSFDVGTFCALSAAALWAHDRVFGEGQPGPHPAWLFDMTAGAAAIFAPFLGWVAASGSFHAFINEWIMVGARSQWAQPVIWASRSPWKVSVPAIVLIVLGALVCYKGSVKRAASAELKAVVPVLVYASAFYAFAFRALSGPQFENALALPVLFIFYALWKLGRSLVGKRTPAWAAAPIAAALVLFIGLSENRIYGGRGWWPNYWFYQANKAKVVPHYWGLYSAGGVMRRIDSRIPRASGIKVPHYQAAEIEQVCETVRREVPPGEPLFCFPELDIFNFLCERPSISRFSLAAFARTVPAWREELLSKLVLERPRIVLVQNVLSVIAQAQRSEREVLPEVRAYILTAYEKIGSAGTVDIYALKGRAPI